MYNKVPASPSGARVSSYPCVSFRALGPARAGHSSCFSLDTAPGAAGNRSWVLSCKSPPSHKQQEKKRSNCHLVLAATTQQAGRRTTESARVRRYSFYRLCLQNRPLHDPVPKTGVLRGGTPKPGFAYFCLVAKVGRAGARNAPPPEGRRPSSPVGTAKTCIRPTAKADRAWGHEISPAPAGKRTAPRRFA